MNILATILIIIADLLYVVSMLVKKKSGLVLLLLISDIFYACQFLCYDKGLTGALSILVDIIFLITVFFLERYGKDKYILVASSVAIIINIIFGIISWAGAISLLPIFAMTAYFLGMMINELYYVKVGALIRNTCNIIYMLLLSQYVGAVLEICLAVSAVVGIVISIIHEKRKLINN